METSYGSFVDVTPCTCGVIPFPHAQVTIDDLMFHPVLSRHGVVLTTQRDDIGMSEEEIDEVRSFVQDAALPETHLLDISTPHLTGVEVDEIGEDEEARAYFEICYYCGNHGILTSHEGEELSRPLTKQEALKDLEKFVSQGLIRMADDNHVRIQILESKLPDRLKDEEADPDNDDSPF